MNNLKSMYEWPFYFFVLYRTFLLSLHYLRNFIGWNIEDFLGLDKQKIIRKYNPSIRLNRNNPVMIGW